MPFSFSSHNLMMCELSSNLIGVHGTCGQREGHEAYQPYQPYQRRRSVSSCALSQRSEAYPLLIVCVGFGGED